MVRVTGLEPASLATYGPEPYVFASFTIPAYILLCHSTTELRKELYGKDSCGAQNRWSLLLVANDFDRYAFFASLNPPPAALGKKATNSAIPAYLVNNEE